jgi:Polyketide cyclase / dehydrase and lipid transport
MLSGPGRPDWHGASVILRIVLIIAVMIAAVLIFAATKPDAVHVSRSVTINAPADKIFSLIDDFHNWPRWAPQDKEDPTIKRSYSGAASGDGAISNWDSTGNAGKGQMIIMESAPPLKGVGKVVVKVDFVKPFTVHNVNEFTLEPGLSTTVTWTMRGSNLYFMKLMGIFVNMDRMMGKHFETGLQNLKAAAES